MKKHLSFLTSFILGASLLFAGYEQTAAAEADADGSQSAEDTSSDSPVVFLYLRHQCGGNDGGL